MIETERLVAFDLEILEGWEPEKDWRDCLPLQVSVAATSTLGHDILWFSLDETQPAQAMSKGDLSGLLDYLVTMQGAGFTVVTWNGLGFDFALLQTILPEYTKILVDLALNHWDIMFQLWWTKGHPLSLQKAARGLEVGSKAGNGSLAPGWWSSGQYAKVLRYVRQDARLTLNVARAVFAREVSGIPWISSRGFINFCHIPEAKTPLELLQDGSAVSRWLVEPHDAYKWTSWGENDGYDILR